MFDKYLGDALYAAMVYVLFRPLTVPGRALLIAAGVMLAIELFQLTRIPAGMLHSDSILVRLFGRLLGTQFSYLDLLAYAAGIACIAALDRWRRQVYSS